MKTEYDISDSYLEILGHVKHSEIPTILSNFDLGLIPYPSNPYNDSRFPIKLVEYCASGVIPLITNTNNHQALIGSEMAVFYDVQLSSSLVNSLEKILLETDLNTIRRNGMEWAKQYTYQRRAISALKQFGLK